MASSTIKLNKPLEGLTVTTTVYLTYGWHIRAWVAVLLMRLAVWIGGGKTVVHFEEADGQR